MRTRVGEGEDAGVGEERKAGEDDGEERTGPRDRAHSLVRHLKTHGPPDTGHGPIKMSGCI